MIYIYIQLVICTDCLHISAIQLVSARLLVLCLLADDNARMQEVQSSWSVVG